MRSLLICMIFGLVNARDYGDYQSDLRYEIMYIEIRYDVSVRWKIEGFVEINCSLATTTGQAGVASKSVVGNFDD